MGNLILFLQKTVGQKMIIGLSGLGLCGFLLVHMLGNLLILKGPEAYNLYAHRLSGMILIKVLEIALALFFFSHIALSVLINIRNRKAAGEPYKKPAFFSKKRSSLADRALVFQGLALFVFLIIHLLSFKFGPYYETELEGGAVRDIYRLVAETLKKPLYAGGYSLVFCVLAFHLAHGLPASLKSLGFYHPAYARWAEKLGLLFGLGIGLGFLAPVCYIFFIL